MIYLFFIFLSIPNIKDLPYIINYINKLINNLSLKFNPSHKLKFKKFRNHNNNS